MTIVIGFFSKIQFFKTLVTRNLLIGQETKDNLVRLLSDQSAVKISDLTNHDLAYSEMVRIIIKPLLSLAMLILKEALGGERWKRKSLSSD